MTAGGSPESLALLVAAALLAAACWIASRKDPR